MHPATAFRWADEAEILTFVEARAFATIVTAGEAPLVAHAPVLVDRDDRGVARLLLHLSRGNAIARVLPTRAVIVVTGADAYISPDWYTTENQVPTWNYVAAELTGTLTPTDDATLLDILARQSAMFEGRLPKDRPWTLDKLAPATLATLQKGIVGVTFAIESARGTRKLSQNKSAGDHAAVIAALDASDRAGERDIARDMRQDRDTRAARETPRK